MNRPRSTTVVLPAYGVQQAIPSIIRDLAVARYALLTRGIELDVLILDGGDHGSSATEIAAQQHLPLTLAPGPASGPGEAFLQGLQRVVRDDRADLVVTLDANGRHDPTQIPGLIDVLIERGWDVVIGSRWTKGSRTPGLTPSRWLLGRMANLTFRWVTASPKVGDATTSFRVARTDVVRDLGLDGIPINRYGVHTTLVAKAIANGYRVGEAPIIYRSAIVEGGGLGGQDIWEFLSHLYQLRKAMQRVRRRRLSPVGRAFDVDHFAAEDDLECLAASKYFFDWVLEEFHAYLRGQVLEVGAGTGTITRRLVGRYPHVSVVGLEPADNLFPDLEAYAALTSRVSMRKETLVEYAPRAQEAFEAVLYVNVLEHIADDQREFRLASEVLRPGGAILVFGPALEALYSELDHKAGHYRRYSLRYLRRLTERAGLRVVSLRYFDILGVLPYLIVYRWLHRTEISGSTMWGYDRLIVPVSRLLQRWLRNPPTGKNVILIAVKD
ncbi:MAG: methyltransferase domain-containing protein [Actinomycetota bacterium]|nr:methyltransferase domain-containing protein [Actinomycetota bacterium]